MTHDRIGNRYKVFSRDEQEAWPSGHKQCVNCRLLLSFGDFGTNRGRVVEVCKVCRRAKSSAAYATRDYRRIIYDRAKSRATKRGLSFTIAVEDISIPERCPVLGVPLKRARGRMTDCSPSIDRIDSTRGYEPGNVIVMSNRANRIKSDATLSEIEALAVWLRSTTDRV